jgi:hypothetical protein
MSPDENKTNFSQTKVPGTKKSLMITVPELEMKEFISQIFS